MNIREDKREPIKYYAFLTIAKILFVAVAFINPDIVTITLLIIGVMFEGWAEKTDRKIAQSRPQNLKDGIEYIFCGADSTNNFLFLEQHIHEEVPHMYQAMHQPENMSFIDTSNNNQVFVEVFDYKKPGIFHGVVFSENLKIGEIVIRHELEENYVGIIRLDDYNPEAA
jgi:hypothetical protein